MEETQHKFIRDCVACLQASYGTKIAGAVLTEATKQVCDKLPVLKDPMPLEFFNNKDFPY